MIHTIQTSTELLPIFNPDLYESAISPGTVFNSEQEELAEELPESINPYEMAIDPKKYLCRLVEFANEVIESEILPALKPFGVVDMKVGDFHHPSWYRLGSGRMDVMDINIIVDDSFFKQMPTELARLAADKEAQQYCADHWQDHPGFFSYMPWTVEAIGAGWDYFTETRQRSAYLTLICREKGLLWRDDKTRVDSPAQSLWEQKVSENMYFMDYISEEDVKLIETNRQKEA